MYCIRDDKAKPLTVEHRVNICTVLLLHAASGQILTAGRQAGGTQWSCSMK